MGIRHIDQRRCTGCSVCAEICPMDVIHIDVRSNKAVVRYLRDCQSCFLCEVECPEDAISVVARFERRVPTAW